MLELRIAQPDDHLGAVAAWRAAQAGRGLRPSAARVARVEEKVAGGLLIVAAEETEVVGMALGEPGRAQDGAGDPEPGLLHLAMVFVAPPVQRQGIGAALVEGLADLAWEQGYRSVSVWSRTPEFYEACGFEPSGRTQALADGSLAVHLFAELEPPVREVVVRSEGIRLGQLLKLAELVETGSEGKELLAAGAVEVNGETELRRGRQLVDGDVVTARDQAVRVVLES
ncbi:MAG: putative Acetyltransferase, family [Frankiales bacterium]|nr:putative Acetyltransferase, family [Frankiales bacterium]